MAKKEAEIQEVIDNLRRIFQAVNEHSRNAERETQLTGPQLWALQVLADASPMRVSELAHRMFLTSATVVGILDRLEAKELVNRTRSEQDRRAVDLTLTVKGQKVADKAPKVAQVMLLKGLEALPDEQFVIVVEGMRQMVKMLGAEHLTPQPLHS